MNPECRRGTGNDVNIRGIGQPGFPKQGIQPVPQLDLEAGLAANLVIVQWNPMHAGQAPQRPQDLDPDPFVLLLGAHLGQVGDQPPITKSLESAHDLDPDVR